jgi:NADH-quinone oxidoreductase subunit G
MCYAEHLTPSGHCGLCTVELWDEAVEGNWVPVLACVLAPREGMKIRLQSERIEKIRQMVGQLILRSHPCDCDLCEKFGHCELRKIYNRTGFGFTRAIEDSKKKISIARLSGRLLLDREKCIHCGLCISFCREELGEDFLHIPLQDSGQARLKVYPGMKYEERYWLNLIEICPFDALLDEHSLNHLPSWRLKAFDAIGTESSTGNNIKVFVQDNAIAYIKPRFNPHVGRYIPDRVRDLHRENDVNRQDYNILHGQRTEERVLLLFLLEKIGFGHRSAMICNGSLSLENMMLVRQLADILGAKIFVKNRRQKGDGWLISGDQNSNIRSALLTQVIKKNAVEDYGEVEQMIENKQVQTLIVFNEDILSLGFSKEYFSKVDSISFSTHRNLTTQTSHAVIPIRTMFEEDGHFINKDFLLQRSHRAITRRTEAKSLWEWLAMVKNIYSGKIGEEADFQSIENLWRFMEKLIPEFEGIHFETLAPEGVKLDGSRFIDYPFVG